MCSGDPDTIAAIATPPGRGGVGIVRVSGPQVENIARRLLGKLPKPRYATFSKFLSAEAEVIDEGIALFFKAPNSFTGEDVLELQGHGGAVILDLLLQRVLELGARMARPGEFSERAFLNGKLDLTAAEAIADLIDAASIQAAKGAMHSLQGEFSKLIKNLSAEIVDLRKYIEAAIDFAEEEINFLGDAKTSEQLQQLLGKLNQIKTQAYQGTLLREGITVVIAGKPNVGKSSLLNKLSNQDTAIVTAVPGTTRDVLRTSVTIDGIPVHLLDTAGLRESADIIEQEGIKRARDAITHADIILLVIDASSAKTRSRATICKLWPEFFNELPEKNKLIIAFNKIDLTGERSQLLDLSGFNCVLLSAKNGDGLQLLKERIKISLGTSNMGGKFSARRRHLQALDVAKKYLHAAQNSAQQNYGELLAEDLRQAHLALQEITGEFSSQQLLDSIFSEFCIGK